MRYFFTESLGTCAVGLLKQLIKIGNRGKADVIAYGQDGIVGILQLESRLLQPDLIQILGHGVAGVLTEPAAQIGLVEMEWLQNIIKTDPEIFVHMEPAQKLTEPHGVVGIVVADPFLHQVIQKGDAQRPGGSQPVLRVHTGGQNGVGDPVLVILHLRQGKGQSLGQQIFIVGLPEILTHKAAEGIEEIGVDDNIPVLAGVAVLPVEEMDIIQIQKDHITGVQHPCLPVQGVGDRALQNIEDLIELVTVNDLVTVFCYFGVKGMFRGGHPILQHDVVHKITS